MRNHRLIARCLIGLVSGLILSCSTATSTGSSRPVAQELEQDQVVIVRVATTRGPMLPGAQVLLVTSSGIKQVGVTDSLGVAKIPGARLTVSDAYALLVCAEHFHCGALRVDAPGFQGFRDHFIALAPFTIH